MSTEYYKLKKPFTSIRVTRTPSHAKIDLWEEYAFCGTLTVLAENEYEILRMFFNCEHPVMETHWGGQEIGSVVDTFDTNLAGCVLLNEYGELKTSSEVRARAGARRADGWPTELFGYE